MNKIVVTICLFLLTSCAVKYPETANINLQIPDQSAQIYNNLTVFVQGKDLRENPEIVFYRVKKEPAVKVPNLSSPLVVITERLTGGLREQGLQFENDSPVRIDLELDQLLVTVTKPKKMYSIDAVSQITLNAIHGKKSLTKKFNRQADRKSVSLPKIEEIENMLNDQLSEIVMQILSDMELRELMMQQ